jgi:selenium metabolism protein YedF
MADTGTGAPAGTLVVIGAETMGRGDEGLGAKLLGSFLRTLATIDPKPDAIVFYNAAVKLLGPGSIHLEPLRQLDDAGVDLLACVTCLEFFALTQTLAIGQVSNMREIVQRSLAAAKVVTV